MCLDTLGCSTTILIVLDSHRTDVHHLLGAHIVGVHDECLGVGVQQVAQLQVILQTANKRNKWRPWRM